MPSPFKINMLDKQIKLPFPMQHPFTSHMSYNALFPSYIAPEDPKRGEIPLKCESMIYDVQTGSRVDDTVVNKKTHGFPFRLETQQLQLPTQRRGEWYEDKQYYHVNNNNNLLPRGYQVFFSEDMLIKLNSVKSLSIPSFKTI